MATRAELARYEAERKHDPKHPKKAKKGPKQRKATPTKAHAKSSAPLLLTSNAKARTPEQRARRAKAQRTRVRGSK